MIAVKFSRLSGLLGFSVGAVLLIAGALKVDGAPAGSEQAAENRPELCQVATLRNGFSIRYLRHEAAGPATRLWVCADAGVGYVEVPTQQIEGFAQGQSAAPLSTPASVPETTAPGMLPVKDRIGRLIAGAASRYQIDPDFVSSVVKAESGFNPAAISSKGARGLMQLMPQTAAGLGVENVLDPAANVEGGTRYLRQLLDDYDGDALKALAAYNAGPQRVKQYGGIPPYRETRAYIVRIIDDYNRKKVQEQAHSTERSADK